MSERMKRRLRIGAFVAGGAGLGLLYYQFFGCTTGCVLTSSPGGTMAYGALLGWLLLGFLSQKKGA